MFTSAQKVMLRDGVASRDFSFQSIFGGNFCTENLACFRLDFSVYMLKCVFCGHILL